jgi:hypothetical protein
MILLKGYQMYNKYFKIGFNHHCFYYCFEQLKLLLLKTREPVRSFFSAIYNQTGITDDVENQDNFRHKLRKD